MAFSREASVVHEGVQYSAFERHTVIARVEHDSGFACIVVFPRGYLSTGFNREDSIATALFAAGVAYAEGRNTILVQGA